MAAGVTDCRWKVSDLVAVLDAEEPSTSGVDFGSMLGIPAENQNIEKQRLLASFVEWIVTSGQRECSALGYVPLCCRLLIDQLFADIDNRQISLQRLVYKSAESGFGLGARASP
jgi:hypothetical protein